MDKAKISSEAGQFFEWPGDDKRTVTFTSCLFFAEHIAMLATEQERKRCAGLCEDMADSSSYVLQRSGAMAMAESCARIIRSNK